MQEFEKELEGIRKCHFSRIPVKICAKKISDFEGCVSP